MDARPLFIELQLQRAGSDLWAYMRAQVPGTIVALLAAIFTAPAIAMITHADFRTVFWSVIAQSLAGPVIVFILSFAVFFFSAPGKLHGEALASAHVLQKNQKFSFSLYPATTIAAIFIATILSALCFWLSEYFVVQSLTNANQRQAHELKVAQEAATSWEKRAVVSLPTKPLSPITGTHLSPIASSLPKLSSAPKVNAAKPEPNIPLAPPAIQVPAPIPTFVPPPPSAPNGPRSLSVGQQRFLVSALSPLSGKVSQSIILWVPNDNETFSYSSDFQKVFVRAGLKPSWTQINPESPDEIGVMIEIQPDTPQDIVKTVKAIFTKAGIPVKTINRPKQAMNAQIILFVGPQPF